MSIYLGLDFGEKRIGLACSDELHRFSEPFGILETKSKSFAENLKEIVESHGVCEVVVGLPRRTGGELHKEAERVLAFVTQLQSWLSVPVTTWDERFTTKIADQILTEANIKHEHRKGKRDALAAAVMLQGYLDFKRLGNQSV